MNIRSGSDVRVLLIDADVLVYRFATSAQEAIQWDRDLYTVHARLEPAIARANEFVENLRATLRADVMLFALSDPGDSFRKGAFPDYKSRRSVQMRPLLWKAMREHFEKTFKARWSPSLEGDDLLGIWATEPHQNERIVCSIDKDMRTIPGKHFNWDKPSLGVEEVSLAQANRFHLMQTLMGDAADGYPGCPGIGPKRAERLLDATPGDDPWSEIVLAFEKAGSKRAEEDALANARCAHILRHGDYDFNTNTVVRLWTPGGEK